MMSAVRHVAGLLGMSPETLRLWQRRYEVDAGTKPGVTTDAAARIKQLEKEVSELHKANEVLKAASVFFAKELDRPFSQHKCPVLSRLPQARLNGADVGAEDASAEEPGSKGAGRVFPEEWQLS
ncbi:hypothetical protein D8Y23_06730 [Microbacterium enclense]|uniref:Transposase n=1 Tax=Microbacterium enclense TaxID=993073 RepID=A0A3S3L9L3_9MICO|nr:transposase [Microbacterium enclense]RWR19939.1 hypothetical protein D8Y23_06730 [Microbacterium enclense]